MTFTYILLILTVTMCINLGLLLLIRKSHSRPALIKIFQGHILSIIGWALFILILLIHAKTQQFPVYTSGESGYVLAQIVFLFATLMVSTNYWFVERFINGKITLHLRNKIILLLQLITLSICIFPNTLYTDIMVKPEGYVSLTITPLNTVYGIFLLSHLIIPLILLFRARKKSIAGNKRSQIHILFLIYFLFLVVSMTFNWVLPVYYNIFNFNSLGPTTSLIVVGGITYAIMKYQFLEIRIFIQRGLIYTILLSFIIILYSAVLTLSNNLFPDGGATERFFSSIFTILIAVFSVPRIDAYLRKKTDPFFFKGTYSYTEALHTLSRAMQDSLQMDTLLTTAEANLKEILRASSVHIVKDETMQEDGELHIPIKLQDKLVGIIILGKKLSGEAYSEQDRQLLKTFARQAAIAIGRIMLYKEVKKRAEELEEKVAERTQELQDTQEKQRITMLQISHNLQTPLTILQTKIEGVKKIKGMEQTAEGLTRSLQNLSFFISDLLRYARLDTQQETFEITHCDMSTALYELSEELTVIAEPNGITITNNITDNIFIQADCKKIREVFMNIASNALKYMGDTGRRELSISVTKENGNAVCTISDTGIGIAPEHLPHIFDQFYRVKGTHAEGTGLGLAISKKIIEKHNGSITVTSTVGSGTTFTVTLPIATGK